jgi:hypothetical protein
MCAFILPTLRHTVHAVLPGTLKWTSQLYYFSCRQDRICEYLLKDSITPHISFQHCGYSMVPKNWNCWSLNTRSVDQLDLSDSRLLIVGSDTRFPGSRRKHVQRESKCNVSTQAFSTIHAIAALYSINKYKYIVYLHP